jgi:hypothetical protein
MARLARFVWYNPSSPQQIVSRWLMAEASKSLSWLPGFLIVGGVFFLLAGLLTDGPDRVGGIVFGVVSLAAAGAIFHRRARDARAAPSQGEAIEPNADHQSDQARHSS